MFIGKYDIVQVSPDHMWGGSLVIVTELFSWGVQGYAPIPMRGRAYIRLRYDEIEVVGRAVYAAEGD